MYAYIIGQVTAMETEKLILENNGIGYELAISNKAMSRFQVGEEVKVYTRYIVREDGVFLYGFYDEQEREIELVDQLKHFSLTEEPLLPMQGEEQAEFDVALQGLINLGYQRNEAMRALNGLDPSLPLSALMRMALQRLG